MYAYLIFMYASAHPNPSSWVFKQSKLSFRVKIVVILSVAQLVRIVIFSQLEISHVLNGPTVKNTDIEDLRLKSVNFIEISLVSYTSQLPAQPFLA